MSTIFLNGAFVAPGEARVSAFDAGFQHGVGLFETMTAVARPGVRPRVLALWEHLERLRTSAVELGLVSSLHVNALAEAVERTAAKEAEASRDTERFRVRLTLSGGDLNLLVRRAPNAPPGDRSGHEPTLMIHVQPATVYPDEMFERGVTAVVGDFKANPLDPTAGHKTLNYWARLRELQTAAAKGAAEALIFQVSNHLAGGAVSNAFVVKDGVLITPIARGEEEEVGGGGVSPGSGLSPVEADRPAPKPRSGGVLPSPVLPGVTRRWVMDWATGAGQPVVRRMVTIADVLEADEVMLTNSSWGVLPVVAVEQSRIGGGEPGPVTNRLMSAHFEMLGREPESL